MGIGTQLKISVIFVNYGPYHIARARALAARPEVHGSFIELTPATASHPWETSGEDLGFRLTSLNGSLDLAGQPAMILRLWRELEELSPDVVAGCGSTCLRCSRLAPGRAGASVGRF